MIKYFANMQKNKHLFFSFSFLLAVLFFGFLFTNKVFATPVISSFLLNGSAQSMTFNPNNSESVSIQIQANETVKFTRVYICTISQACNGTSGNYTRYFSPNTTSDSVSETWDGKGVGDASVVSAGEYKVMVSMVEGSSSATTAFGQYSIFVDFSSQSNSTTTSTTTNSNNGDSNSSTSTSTMASDTSNQDTQTTKTVTRTVYISTHSSPEDLSNYEQKTPFETSAGRERMALVGSPIEFDAKYTLSQNNQCSPNFNWSFGDGFGAIGKDTKHTYKYPGEYRVVLNGSCWENNSISRTMVEVVSPNISISNLPSGDTEITNNGKVEANIGNWKIKSIQKEFTFPQDTIIGANSKITLSKEDFDNGSSTTMISLNNPSGWEVTYSGITDIGTKNISLASSTENNQNKTSAVDSNIVTVDAEKLVQKYKQKLVSVKQDVVAENFKKSNIIENSDDNLQNNTDIIQTASVLDTVASSSKESIWSKIINTPINAIKSFTRMFYNF